MSFLDPSWVVDNGFTSETKNHRNCFEWLQRFNRVMERMKEMKQWWQEVEDAGPLYNNTNVCLFIIIW